MNQPRTPTRPPAPAGVGPFAPATPVTVRYAGATRPATVVREDYSMSIDLRCQDVAAMLAGLAEGCSPLIHADPPWRYRNNENGKAQAHYPGLPHAVIAAHLVSAYRVAAPDSYLAVWCTFPKLAEWMSHSIAPWEYVTGAAWGKTGGAWGVGYHFRGDAELVLLYRKGKPTPIDQASNLWLTEDAPGALWVADRGKHSEKPQVALRTLVSMGAAPGALVVDLYAGESASMARACKALGRRYIGAELDPTRHAKALDRLSQQEAFVERAVPVPPEQLALLAVAS